MVLTKMKVSFVIDEEEPSLYTVEDTISEPPYDNIEIMHRRTVNQKGGEKK